jgi:hypothetical protein
MIVRHARVAQRTMRRLRQPIAPLSPFGGLGLAGGLLLTDPQASHFHGPVHERQI